MSVPPEVPSAQDGRQPSRRRRAAVVVAATLALPLSWGAVQLSPTVTVDRTCEQALHCTIQR